LPAEENAMRVRPAAVAGTFYPEEARELEGFLRRLLDEAGRERARSPAPKALIAPHAGYVYSGAVAATAFATLAPDASRVRRVVLLGPAHFVPLRGLALPRAEALATPLGEVPVDAGAAAALRTLPQVAERDDAHAREHALEVELPFLQHLLGDFTVVPLVAGAASAGEVAEVLAAVWGGEETRVVVSSDLSHYMPYETARRVDRETADAVVRLEYPLAPHQACGAVPISGLLAAAAGRGLRPTLLDLRNSGDTAGPRDRVVGYGAFAFHGA
jgi:AmmeMemoRadiSam system protein B